MPCLGIIFGAFFPRLAMIVIWLCTSWFSIAFDGILWPVLGFFFMPFLTLAYMAAMINNHHHVDGFWLALVIVAALVDLGGHTSMTRRRSWRRR